MADSAEPKSTSPKGQTDVKGQGGKAPGSGKKKDKKEKKASKENQSQNEAQKKQGAGKGAENKSDQGQNDPNKPQKTKAELKAERRMLQEKQRAEKQVKASGGGAKEGGASVLKKEVKRVPDNIRADDAQTSKRIAKKLEKQQIPPRTTAQRKVQLFSHLHQYEREVSLTKPLSFSSTGLIHPMIIKLGLQYAEGVISGSNARCLAMLAVFKKVITDYKTPPQKELSRDLEVKIKPYISFLNQCRMQSIGMGNAIKYIKWHISHVPSDKNDTEAKEILLEAIDNFIRERILLAADAISKYVKEEKKIKDGDVIVVFSCSSIVRRVLCDAHKEKINFRVIVVDARPKMEGKEMLRRLVRAGIKCSYVLINAASYAMQEATKVFLGAHALLANGCVMSRVGTSLITLIAKSCNVPVLVCCETYKFCERGQTDSFVYNELGDPDDLVSIGNRTPYLNDWRDYSSLTLLNLIYDVTPPEFVSLVITELGLIPCTSVPVVLRMKQAETNET